jgi:hypothetical protein
MAKHTAVIGSRNHSRQSKVDNAYIFSEAAVCFHPREPQKATNCVTFEIVILERESFQVTQASPYIKTKRMRGGPSSIASLTNAAHFQGHTVTIGMLVNQYVETELQELQHSTANVNRSFTNQIKLR